MQAGKHQCTTEDLDGVADQHHTPLRHGVGKGANKTSEQNVRSCKKEFQQGNLFCRGMEVPQDRDGSNQQRIVCQRRKKLRGHDDIKAQTHVVSRECEPSAGYAEAAFIPQSVLLSVLSKSRNVDLLPILEFDSGASIS